MELTNAEKQIIYTIINKHNLKWCIIQNHKTHDLLFFNYTTCEEKPIKDGILELVKGMTFIEDYPLTSEEIKILENLLRRICTEENFERVIKCLRCQPEKSIDTNKEVYVVLRADLRTMEEDTIPNFEFKTCDTVLDNIYDYIDENLEKDISELNENSEDGVYKHKSFSNIIADNNGNPIYEYCVAKTTVGKLEDMITKIKESVI